MKILLHLIFFIPTLACGQNNKTILSIDSLNYPNPSWNYINPAEADWSGDNVKAINAWYRRSGSAALLIIHKGKVIMSLGDVNKKYHCHSMRKSILSALYGIYIGKGIIDIETTLAELNINDITPLSAEEKNASIKHLLTSSSGVFLPAAAEGAIKKPERGSYTPGVKFVYNNWDFNALGTIFEQECEIGIFEAFKKDISDKIGMEDFELADTYYLKDERTIHRAYLFRMSSFDLARFGLLYLNYGMWKNERILPAQWVQSSTKPHIYVGKGIYYGYLWNVHPKLEMYAAEGFGGHALMIFPNEDIVVVHRVNTFEPNNIVGWKKIIKLTELVRKAK